MKHTLTLRNRPFYNILKRVKKWEGRLFQGKYQRIRIGDHMVFKNVEDHSEKRKLEVKVTSIHVFSSFKEAFAMINMSEVIPGHTLTQCLDIYHGYYPQDKIKTGVVFFGIELLRVF